MQNLDETRGIPSKDDLRRGCCHRLSHQNHSSLSLTHLRRSGRPPQVSSLDNIVTAQWDDVFQAIEACYQLGWTDGLPVVPPTTERVAQFLGYVGREPSELLGEIPERRRRVTVEKAAANAVMAGCLPQHLPVVLAATEAMLAPKTAGRRTSTASSRGSDRWPLRPGPLPATQAGSALWRG